MTEAQFNVEELCGTFPPTADEMMKDIRMINGANASCRLVRMYSDLPLHVHRTSDENVYVVSGRATFQLDEEKIELSSGMFIHFAKGTPHAVLDIREHPLITLTIDTPCRPESDTTFI